MQKQRGLSTDSPASWFGRNRVNIPGMTEVIWQPLYDYQTKTAAATALQRFFLEPQGQAGKTIADTNMEIAGQIPKGQAFLCTGIQVELYPAVAIGGTTSEFADDVYNFYNSGYLRFTIGSKDFVQQGNLMKFAPVNRLDIDAATGEAQGYVYAAAAGREFATSGLLLESNQNFNVDLGELSAVSADCKIGVTLNGYLGRNAQ